MKFTNEPQIPLTMKEPCPPKKLFGCRFWSPASPFVWFVTLTYLRFVPQRVAVRCVAVCFSGFQCVAVCCSVLQCAVVCCFVLQCVAVCCCVLCSVLPCIVVCCSVLQCVAVCCIVSPHCNTLKHTTRTECFSRGAVCCNVLQFAAVKRCTATHCFSESTSPCNTIPHAAKTESPRVECSVMQCVAACCSMLILGRRDHPHWRPFTEICGWRTHAFTHPHTYTHTHIHTYTHTHTHTWTHTFT